MAKTREELEQEYVELARLVEEQNLMLDGYIGKMSLKLKKSARQYFKENERKELFLRNKGLFDEYEDFKKEIKSDSKKSKIGRAHV